MSKKDIVAAHFALKAPCGNCPFKITGAIELEPGRLDGIIEHLLNDDRSTFQCHKTVHAKTGGDWDEDGEYCPSGNEAMCAGATIYLEKLARPTIGMRLAHLHGAYDPSKLKKHFACIMEPPPMVAKQNTE